MYWWFIPLGIVTLGVFALPILFWIDRRHQDPLPTHHRLRYAGQWLILLLIVESTWFFGIAAEVVHYNETTGTIETISSTATWTFFGTLIGGFIIAILLFAASWWIRRQQQNREYERRLRARA